MIGIIYKTVNLVNNKIYIGKDSKNNPEYYGSGIALNKAIKKYGKENFKKYILCELDSIEKLNDMEKKMIIYYDSFINKNGYNISYGGDGGNTFTNNPNKEIIRKKISEKSIGRIVSNETRRKIGDKQKGVPRPQTTGEKNPAKRIDVREKLRQANICEKNPMYGHIYTMEERKKISNSLKGHIVTNETREKISNSLTGSKMSDEVKLKISKTLSGKKQSEKTKRKRIESRKKSSILRGQW